MEKNHFEIHDEDARKTRREVRPLFIDQVDTERFSIKWKSELYPNKDGVMESRRRPCLIFDDTDGTLKSYLYELHIDDDAVDVGTVVKCILARQDDFEPMEDVKRCFLWRSASFVLSACFALKNVGEEYDRDASQKMLAVDDVFDDYGVDLLARPSLVSFKDGCTCVDFFRLITIICAKYEDELSTADDTEISARRFFEWLMQDCTDSVGLVAIFNAFDEFSCYGYRTDGTSKAFSAREDLQLINYLCAFHLATYLTAYGKNDADDGDK